MTRTVAPKERGGRLDLNCARTAPELPVAMNHHQHQFYRIPSQNQWPKISVLLQGKELRVPCGRVTVPQIALIFEPRTSLEAR